MTATIEALTKEIIILHSTLAHRTLEAHQAKDRLAMKNRECNDRAAERQLISEQLRELGFQLTQDGKIMKKV